MVKRRNVFSLFDELFFFIMVPIAIHYLGPVDEHTRPLILSMKFRTERKALLDGEARERFVWVLLTWQGSRGDTQRWCWAGSQCPGSAPGPWGGSLRTWVLFAGWSPSSLVSGNERYYNMVHLRHDSMAISWVLFILAVCTTTIEPPICDHFNWAVWTFSPSPPLAWCE